MNPPETLSHMPAPRRSCPCRRCNGALVSARTARRHAHTLPSGRPSDSIISYTAWFERSNFNKQLQSRDSPGDNDSDSDTGIHSLTPLADRSSQPSNSTAVSAPILPPKPSPVPTPGSSVLVAAAHVGDTTSGALAVSSMGQRLRCPVSYFFP